MFALPSFDRLNFTNLPAHELLKLGLRILTTALCIFGALRSVPASAMAGANPPHSPENQADGTTYYLTKRIPVTTESGVRSVLIGTKVTFAGRVKDGMKVRLPDGTELVVTPEQLTQDAARAQQLADEERAQSSSAAAEARTRAEAHHAAETDRRAREIAAAQKYLREAQNVAPSAPATPRPWGLIGSALDEKPTVVATVRPPKKKK